MTFLPDFPSFAFRKARRDCGWEQSLPLLGRATSTDNPATAIEATPNREGTLKTNTWRWVTAALNSLRTHAWARVFGAETIKPSTGTPSYGRTKSTTHHYRGRGKYTGLQDSTRRGKRWQDLFKHINTRVTSNRKRIAFTKGPLQAAMKSSSQMLRHPKKLLQEKLGGIQGPKLFQDVFIFYIIHEQMRVKHG